MDDIDRINARTFRIILDTLLSELDEIRKYCSLQYVEYYKGQYAAVVDIARKFGIIYDEELHAKLNDVMYYIENSKEYADEKI